MKRVFALLVSCLSSAALAQVVVEDDDGNVEVMVPGAAVHVQQTGSTTMVVPGAAVQLQAGATRTTTATVGMGVNLGVGVGVGVAVPGVGVGVAVQPGVVVQTPAPVVVRERVVVQQQPVVVHQPVVVQQPVVARDCGTGPGDPGCMMSKNGMYPMDGVALHGALKSLRAQRNTIVREEMATKMFARAMLTAAQLGLVLDVFADHGITQLDVAKTLAPNVVNPQHALSHSTKFTNSISAEEYVETMSAQSPGY
ncbi:MAG: DUF4476 domain-containing protein [Myxococcaceae bacterium]|nr:DUF4476 domain-containing protein [Myxococcaceae bacterium]